MRIAVFSDTHGRVDGVLRAIEAEKPDAMIHLGDCERDVRPIQKQFPALPVYNVSGNCDYSCAVPDTSYFTLEGVKILATHGHRYGVKMSLDPLLNAAYFSKSKLVLYGHTHIPYNKDEMGIRVMNPGTSGLGYRRSYGMLELINGTVVSCVVKSIPELEGSE